MVPFFPRLQYGLRADCIQNTPSPASDQGSIALPAGRFALDGIVSRCCHPTHSHERSGENVLGVAQIGLFVLILGMALNVVCV
jgi:hypothetical protein